MWHMTEVITGTVPLTTTLALSSGINAADQFYVTWVLALGLLLFMAGFVFTARGVPS